MGELNSTKWKTAKSFGESLDQDNFTETTKLLDPYCIYDIGDKTLTGPEKIVDSYESNMIEGRAKFDFLEWGKSRIEQVSDHEFYVHFTDYLGHQGVKYTHRCKQKITINDVNKITRIVHIHNEDEANRLNAFKRQVGLL